MSLLPSHSTDCCWLNCLQTTMSPHVYRSWLRSSWILTCLSSLKISRLSALVVCDFLLLICYGPLSYVCRAIVLCVPGSGRYTLNCGKCTAWLLFSSLCQGRCRLAKPKESVMARSLIPDCRLMEWLLKRNTRLPRWRNRLQGKGMAMAMNGYQDKVHMHDCEQRLKHGLKFKCI